MLGLQSLRPDLIGFALTPPRYLTVCEYHERTKHHYHRMARSSGYMDWANQPDPFRRYTGATSVVLPFSASDPDLDYHALFSAALPEPAPLTKATVAVFLELSLGLSAWKAIGRDRWALRINPSSGNLHPTEAYLLLTQIEGLADGLYHYGPEKNVLEKRRSLTRKHAIALAAHFEGPGFLVALSSIIWREAWKYGERAFRYCQLDIGHALAALGFSARLQGWRLCCLTGVGEKDLAQFLGFDRTAWHPQEEETPEVLVRVAPPAAARSTASLPEGFVHAVAARPVQGQPNQLSPACRRWEAIHAVTAATCQEKSAEVPDELPSAPAIPEKPVSRKAADVIRRRRSAVAFDPRGQMNRSDFFRLMGRTCAFADCPPLDIGLGAPRISLLLFVHQVTDLAAGLYMFIRHASHRDALRAACDPAFRWQHAAEDLPIYLLQKGDHRATAAELACRQEIAGSSVFSLAMLAAFRKPLEDSPWRYRRLFWEAGQIGQVLYLEAEARGYRGTGIGCYFDDPVHDLIGVSDNSWQDLYHFTVGRPIEDPRLQTFPPYEHLKDANSDARQ